MAVGTPGQNGGRIIMKTGVIAAMPNLFTTPNPGAAALMLPEEPNRISMAVTVNGLTFIAESATQLAAFGTTGAYVISAATGTVPLQMPTTGPIYAAGYDATGTLFAFRYIAFYWVP